MQVSVSAIEPAFEIRAALEIANEAAIDFLRQKKSGHAWQRIQYKVRRENHVQKIPNNSRPLAVDTKDFDTLAHAGF